LGPTRPLLSKERLERRADGRFELELKSVWRDGTRALVFEPLELIESRASSPADPRDEVTYSLNIGVRLAAA
jgi:hypothetical protein